MSHDELPREADVQQVRWHLNEGLKSCRAMVANYRQMLEGGANDNELATSQDQRGLLNNEGEGGA